MLIPLTQKPYGYACQSGVYNHTPTVLGYALRDFDKHSVLKHSAKEYARGDDHTNTVEGVFSIFKRGTVGVYQHCGPQHLHRYLTEFDFRCNHRTALGVDDEGRTAAMLGGIVGRRLMYRDSSAA